MFSSMINFSFNFVFPGLNYSKTTTRKTRLVLNGRTLGRDSAFMSLEGLLVLVESQVFENT